MIVEVYLERGVSDITFVPISINFDRSMEDSLFAREMIGIPKPKESTKVRIIMQNCFSRTKFKLSCSNVSRAY